MAPSTLDLLVLTFNCAKTLVNAPVFAEHLETAFSDNATGLPDVVVFSLQEIAPLSYSFIGGSFLNPYVTRFEEAINLAAIRHEGDDDATVSVTPTQDPKKYYTLVRARNVGYTAMLLFARDPTRLQDIQEAEVGFGAADMGNKGAVGLRATYEDPDNRASSAEMTFVATHLAAMEWNLPRRNANWAAIMRALTFQDPEVVVESFRTNGTSGNGGEDERSHLLQGEDNHEADGQLQRQLHDISVFKPSSHLFVAGDLNYRISTTSPPADAAFPSLDPASEKYYPRFFAHDQLTRERGAGRTMHGLSEAEVTFPPTYKYDVLSGSEEKKVKWKFAPHRWPSWTDRVLYLDLPPWVKSKDKAAEISVRAYNALPLLVTSDHRPVYFRASVPLLPPSAMRPSAEVVNGDVCDPRVRLPVEIDPEAWGRRAAARRREVMIGWSSFLWSTQEGALILTSLVIAGLGGYWLYRSY